MSVQEEQLLKALSDMEAVAKGGVSAGMSGQGNKTPKTTADANGGLSNEGDKQELAAKSEDEEELDVVKGKKGKKMSLKEWAAEEEEEHSKGFDSDEENFFGKGKDEEEDYEDEEDEDDEDAEKCAKKSLVGSSLSDLIKSNDQGGAVVDVSPFIETLVDQVSDADMELRKAIVDMQETNSSYQHGMQKSMVAMGNMILDINKKLNSIMDLPAGERRSVLSKSEINDRFEEAQPDFSKTQVLDAMVDLARSGSIQSVDVSRFETTGTMEANVAKAVTDHLQKSL